MEFWEGGQGTGIPPCRREKAVPGTQGRSLLSLCFQDCAAAEKESKVLRIVSLWGEQGVGMEGGMGLRLDILLPLPQCSHVAGICHNILSYSPKELLEQRAVLERVQLDNPLVSLDFSSLTSDPPAASPGP